MERYTQKQWFWPAVISSTGLVITILLSFIVRELSIQQEKHLIQNTSKAKVELIEHQFLTTLPSTLSALERMRNRWVIRDGIPFKDWQLDAANYVRDNEGLRAVEWVDSEYIVRWVEPIEGNEQAQGLDLSFEPKRKLALDLAKQKGEFTLTKPIDLVQGGKGFLSYFPIYSGELFQGFILGVFDISKLIEHMLPEHFTDDFNIAVYSEQELLYENAGEHLTYESEIGFSRKFELHGTSWQLYIWPKEFRVIEDVSYVPLLVLGVGLFISVLLGIALFYGLFSRATSLQLRKREIEYKATLSSTIDGIITIDDRGNVLSANKAAEETFGYAESELVGNNIKMLMPEPYQSEHDKYLSNYATTGEAKIMGKGRRVYGKHKNGRIFHMDLGVTSYSIGEQVYYCGMVRDITEQVRFEQEREAMMEQLQNSNVELDNFAYIASHDLKEPLRAIKNHSSFLLEDYEDTLDPDGQHKLNRLIYLSSRMEKLISDLLYYSRLGREAPVEETVDVTELVNDVLERIKEQIIERNVTIKVEPLPTVTCDPVRFTELLYNLITNAYKYNRSEVKTIDIGCSYKSGTWTFSVKDNGIGIDKRFDTDVFKIFKRLNSPKQFGEGTGAGLTFAKKIVEQHKGQIWFEPVAGGGTCFYFTIKEK